MKVLIGFLYLLFVSMDVSSDEINSWEQLVKKGNTYYKKSDNLPFTGILKNFFESGEISLIDHFKNGKQHGKFKSFHKNGKLSMVGDFFDGKQNGEWFEYYDDGSLYWRLIYKNGVKKDGVFRMYHKNGKIRSEVLYENDKPASNWIFFDESGKKEREDVYKDGKFFYEKYFD